MAYIIRQGNILSKIAKDDTDKNEQNLSSEIYSSIDISDSDFLKLKTSKAVAVIDGDNVTFTDIGSGSFPDQATLENYINECVLKPLNMFLDQSSNNTKDIYATALSYRNELVAQGSDHDIDFASITFPLNKRWEEYCEENSIPYLHPLQIP